jgi:hypothetical protein
MIRFLPYFLGTLALAGKKKRPTGRPMGDAGLGYLWERNLRREKHVGQAASKADAHVSAYPVITLEYLRDFLRFPSEPPLKKDRKNINSPLDVVYEL